MVRRTKRKEKVVMETELTVLEAVIADMQDSASADLFTSAL
ncbi:hypothetical protein [Nonomuraea sp. B19D2]